MEYSGVVSVGTITVICYAFAQIVKATSLDNKWIPIICLISGGLLGVAGIYFMADYPADDILSAIAVGIASGGAATGVNQTLKQMSSHSGDEE